MNDAATIWTFIKGLKNATCIYEKGPHMLSNIISEVEKLNAVQQLTATITPPYMVNMMSNNEDHCFQCQEQEYVARNCPHIRFFNVMSMDTLYWIVHTGYLFWEPQQSTMNPNHTKTTMPGQQMDCQ